MYSNAILKTELVFLQKFLSMIFFLWNKIIKYVN